MMIGFSIQSSTERLYFFTSSVEILDEWFLVLEKAMVLSEVQEAYTFESVVGSGNGGIVYKARNHGTDCWHAIKVIEKTTLKNPELLHNLKNEINALRLVNHPFLIYLYGVYEDASNIYIATELVKRGDLLARVVGNKFITEDDAAKYVRSLLLALEYLHSQKLIHRDVKLENILVSKNSDN
jgi:serine/threonine protein kinase